MAKNPAERYATAQTMASDLDRFLNDEPILARRSSMRQRARRWARKHRPVMVSATVASLTALTVLAGSIGWIMRNGAARAPILPPSSAPPWKNQSASERR